MGSGGPNESKSHQLARIGEQEIFHEPDVHHVSKVGIKRFWPWEAKMSLTAISCLESARRKFFMNSTQNMCKNLESNVFGSSGGRNESNIHQLARIGEKKILINSTQNMCKNLESARRKFFMISSQNMCKNLESNVFGLRRPK